MAKSAKQKVAEIFDGDLKLTDFEKALVREKYSNPQITGAELGARFGVSASSVNAHLKKPQIKKAISRLWVNIFDEIQALQIQAIRNYAVFLKPVDESATSEASIITTKMKIHYMASKDMTQQLLALPAALPESKRERPQFYISGE